MIWINWFIKNENKLTDIENKFKLPKGKGGEGGINYKFGINLYTLLYIK